MRRGREEPARRAQRRLQRVHPRGPVRDFHEPRGPRDPPHVQRAQLDRPRVRVPRRGPSARGRDVLPRPARVGGSSRAKRERASCPRTGSWAARRSRSASPPAVGGIAEVQSFVKCADPADKHCAGADAAELARPPRRRGRRVRARRGVRALDRRRDERGRRSGGAEREGVIARTRPPAAGSPGRGPGGRAKPPPPPATIVAGGAAASPGGGDGARAASRWRTGRQMGSPRKS